jgi:predicted acylesterase/phospholipase RssA
MTDYCTAIVFQGGGALGAYECGVIKALYEKRPNFKPRVVTGISIGAVNAAVLVATKKGSPAEALEKFWRERLAQSPFAFGASGVSEINPEYLLAPLLSTSVLDFGPLRRNLSAAIDLAKLNQPEDIRLVFGAINVKTGEPEFFDNNNPPHYQVGIEHVIASASLPGFPFAEVDGKPCWDGGLFLNTPLSSAINCLEEIEDCDARELIVVELFPKCVPRLPATLAEVSTRASQLILASKIRIDQKFFRTVNKTIDFMNAINRHIPPDIKQDPIYQELFGHKKIDALTVVSADFPLERGDPSDFTQDTIEYRINAGYQAAIKLNIGMPRPVEP